MATIPTVAAGDEITATWGSLVAGNVNALALPIGVECPNAAAVTLTVGEFFVAAPVAGSDPSGFYVAASKRLTIPAALGGLYAWTFYGTAVGGTAGNVRRVLLAIGAIGWGGWANVGQAGNTLYWSISGVSYIPGGTAFILTASNITTGADMAIARAGLYRIGLSG